MVVELIEERLPGDRSLAVHDLAVSDGSTAVNLFERLGAIRRVHSFHRFGPVTRCRRRGTTEQVATAVLDPATNQPLQVIWPPFVFNVEKRESALLYPINRALLVILLRTRVRRLLERYSAADPSIMTRHIRLLAPAVLGALESDQRFVFERHDILQPLAGRFGLVRAMNILNRSDFEDDQLRVAIGHVARALTHGRTVSRRVPTRMPGPPWTEPCTRGPSPASDACDHRQRQPRGRHGARNRGAGRRVPRRHRVTISRHRQPREHGC